MKKKRRFKIIKIGRKKNSQVFEKASIYVICASFLLSLAVISSSFMSQVNLEKYANAQISEVNVLLESRQGRILSTSRYLDEITIGEGVVLADSCQIFETAIICRDV